MINKYSNLQTQQADEGKDSQGSDAENLPKPDNDKEKGPTKPSAKVKVKGVAKKISPVSESEEEEEEEVGGAKSSPKVEVEAEEVSGTEVPAEWDDVASPGDEEDVAGMIECE